MKDKGNGEFMQPAERVYRQFPHAGGTAAGRRKAQQGAEQAAGRNQIYTDQLQ